MTRTEEIKPQAGFQQRFATCSADIAIGGGAAGVGKSWSLIYEPLYNIANPKFSAIFFRRTSPELRADGGLWEAAQSVYREIGGNGHDGRMYWRFPNLANPQETGSRVSFSHLEHEKHKYRHQGAQYDVIGFDELTHFTESMFWYLASRNRSVSGVSPYMRATTNPQASGWIKDMIAWWLYPDDYHIEDLQGLPRPERNGVVRFMTRDGGAIVWADTREELLARVPHLLKHAKLAGIEEKHLIKSFTYISGSIYDNQELLAINPQYLGNLLALDDDEKSKLLRGCWKYTPGENDLYDHNAILDLFTNAFVPTSNNRYITADIAMDGSDLFVIGVWDGMRLIHVEYQEKSDGLGITDAIRILAKRYRVPQRHIAFDADGVGRFLKGFLRSSYSFMNGSKPIPTPFVVQGQKVENYENLKTQCYYTLRHFIQKSRMFLDIDDRFVKNRIIQELSAIEKRPRDNHGSLRISRKDELRNKLGRSPDFADMIAMRMIFVLLRSGKTETHAY